MQQPPHPRLFPAGLLQAEWQQFQAQGYRKPVTGVIYRGEPRPTCGMPLGSVDTGCLDLEPNGMLGYCTLFNDLINPRRLLNMPCMGYHLEGQTRILISDCKIKVDTPTPAASPHQFPPTDYTPRYRTLPLSPAQVCRGLEYWGHFPIADLEFDTGDDISAGVRAYSPFVPGDTRTSLMPGAVFRVRLHNRGQQTRTGGFLFSFPGFGGHAQPQGDEITSRPIAVPTPFVARQVVRQSRDPARTMAYAVAVASTTGPSDWGGGMDDDGSKWGQAGRSLPAPQADETGLSVRMPFVLDADQTEEFTVILAWHAPTWRAGGSPRHTDTRAFKHQYAQAYPSLAAVLAQLCAQYEMVLDKIVAWQETVYAAPHLPGWLADSLINILHLIPECSVWSQAGGALDSWVDPELGLFALNECPRGCPQLECLPCSFYGNIPLLYFFPETALSTLHGYRAYQMPDGRPPWIFGGVTASDPAHRQPYDLAAPDKGYQTVLNGACYIVMADRYWRLSGDDQFLQAFWDSLKRCNDFSLSLRPEYGLSQIMAMPTPGTDGHALGDTEWFEAPEPGWKGYVTHAGGIRMAQVAIMRRMAVAMGDEAYVGQCDTWLAAGQTALEDILWNESCYWNFREPDTDSASDLVFGYQLDGQWIARWHGVDPVFPPERVATTLDTIRRTNCELSQSGAVNYANLDGSVAPVGGYGPYSYFPPELFMLAMTYMYEGHRKFGLELLERCLANMVRWGYVWDFPNTTRGDSDTGQRTFGADYYQNMMLWAVPAALQQSDLTAPCRDQGLVQRLLAAAPTAQDAAS